MRAVQPPGARGSLKWLQVAVNDRPDLLDHPAIGRVEWRSPLRLDDYAEYRDRAFLDCVGIARLNDRLTGFWPTRGPQWDALGVTDGGIVLVEAKAHLGELLSPPTAAGMASRARIDAAFAATQAAIGATPATDWCTAYYQLANRIAHLWFLRQIGVDARLLLVSFINDREMNGPDTVEVWDLAYAAAFASLGIGPDNALMAWVHHVHPDVRAMAG